MRLFIKQIRPTFAAASLVAMMGLPAERAAQDLDYSIDALIDREAADIDPEDIALLVLLRRDPLDINRTDRTELEQLPWITPALAGAIVAWRERHGPFGNTGELVRVQGFTPVLVSRISPFVRVEDDRSFATTGRLRLARSRIDRPDTPGNGILGVQADIGLGNRFKLGGRGERRGPGRRNQVEVRIRGIRRIGYFPQADPRVF